MTIEKIRLTNFRNYEQQEIEFDQGINIIYGDNAQGKTNVVEAVFVCSLGKSFRTNKEREMVNVSVGEGPTMVEVFGKKSDREITVKYELTEEKKSFYINGVKVNRTSDVLREYLCGIVCTG